MNNVFLLLPSMSHNNIKNLNPGSSFKEPIAEVLCVFLFMVRYHEKESTLYHHPTSNFQHVAK